MEWNDLLLVIIIQVFGLLILLRLLRYSNKKLMEEIESIEDRYYKHESFIGVLISNQRDMQDRLSKIKGLPSGNVKKELEALKIFEPIQVTPGSNRFNSIEAKSRLHESKTQYPGANPSAANRAPVPSILRPPKPELKPKPKLDQNRLGLYESKPLGPEKKPVSSSDSSKPESKPLSLETKTEVLAVKKKPAMDEVEQPDEIPIEEEPAGQDETGEKSETDKPGYV